MRDRKFYVYIMTNRTNRVLYTGVTGDLERRVYEHKNELAKGFTSKYKIKKLVYYEEFDDSISAVLREKQIKAGRRNKKVELIQRENEKWKDLSEGWSD